MLTAHHKFHTVQYIIKDHLGNTRMVLNAEEQPQQSYPNCDFEDEHAKENETYYLNADKFIGEMPSGFNTSEGTGARCQVIKNNEAPVGVGKLLKVMVTDEVGVKLDYYIPTAPVDNTGSNPMSHLIESIIAILNNTGYSGAMHGGGENVAHGIDDDIALNSLLYPQSAGNPSPNTVKAYLNILFFDDAFNFVCEQSRYVQLSVMSSAQTVTLLGSSMIAAPANGYAYIYVSNESRNPVFIDNFQAVHKPGRIVQDVSYYPYGMQIAGICSSAANGIENKFKYNGKEEQRQEFSNGSGLELYDFGARMQDPQLGRWWTIDPKADLMRRYSPYNYAFDNPLRFIDPDGMEATDWIKYVDADGVGRVKWVDEAHDQTSAEAWAAKGGKDLNGHYKNSDVKYIGKTGVEYGHDDKGSGTGNYNLNADGTATLIGRDGENGNVTVTAKRSVTKGTLANSEPLARGTADVGEMVQEVTEPLSVVTNATAGMEAIEKKLLERLSLQNRLEAMLRRILDALQKGWPHWM